MLIIFTAVLLSSCSTLKKNADAGEVKTALETLVSDCLLSLPSAPLSKDDLVSALSEDYTVYEEYLPSYKAIESRYLDSVCTVVNAAFGESFFSEEITAAGEELSDNGSIYISGEELMPDIEKKTREKLSVLLEEYLSLHSDALERAFSESRASFNMVKKSYSSLSIINEEIVLPDARALSPSVITGITLDRFYSLLSTSERKLRSNPLYGDTVYRLFWRD